MQSGRAGRRKDIRKRVKDRKGLGEGVKKIRGEKNNLYTKIIGVGKKLSNARTRIENNII